MLRSRTLQLRKLFLRSFTSPSSLSSSNQKSQLLLLHQELLSISPPFRRFLPFLSLPRVSISRPFSAQSSDLIPDEVSRSLSEELLKDPESDPLPIVERLQLSFSHISPNPSLVLQTLNLSSESGRTALGFSEWLSSFPNFQHSDETISYFVNHFGRRKDFKAIHQVLVNGNGISGAKTMESAIDRLVRAGRPTQAVSFFERMETEYGLKRDKASLKVVVEKLCENGYASHAEKMVKNLANEFFPDEIVCDLLIKGWCVDGKLDEAKRLADEMYRGGFEIGIVAYNSILDCVCKICRKKDPFRLHSEAEKVLLDMDFHGIPRNVDTFNVLITNLCKIRKTQDAMDLFDKMGEWNCFPNGETFLVLIRSLYQAARIGEGDEMIDRMKSAGYGDALDKKNYYGFLKILCGIERIDHALSVFTKMKKDRCKPGIKTYDLLMGKLCAHNRLEKANSLFKEAQKRGISVVPKEYRVDPTYLKKKKVKKIEKKRETLPEKTARKRRTLKKIRLSFVKKPKRRMRRAF